MLHCKKVEVVQPSVPFLSTNKEGGEKMLGVLVCTGKSIIDIIVSYHHLGNPFSHTLSPRSTVQLYLCQLSEAVNTVIKYSQNSVNYY